MSLVSAKELASKRRPRFVDESAAYAKAREALLAEELEVRRHLGRLARQNRELPEGPELPGSWRFVGMNGGELALADMFGRHDTLVLYHWMYGPERNRAWAGMEANGVSADDQIPNALGVE